MSVNNSVSLPAQHLNISTEHLQVDGAGSAKCNEGRSLLSDLQEQPSLLNLWKQQIRVDWYWRRHDRAETGNVMVPSQ